jgi:hypothetical protein
MSKCKQAQAGGNSHILASARVDCQKIGENKLSSIMRLKTLSTGAASIRSDVNFVLHRHPMEKTYSLQSRAIMRLDCLVKSTELLNKTRRALSATVLMHASMLLHVCSREHIPNGELVELGENNTMENRMAL